MLCSIFVSVLVVNASFDIALQRNILQIIFTNFIFAILTISFLFSEEGYCFWVGLMKFDYCGSLTLFSLKKMTFCLLFCLEIFSRSVACIHVYWWPSSSLPYYASTTSRNHVFLAPLHQRYWQIERHSHNVWPWTTICAGSSTPKRQEYVTTHLLPSTRYEYAIQELKHSISW